MNKRWILAVEYNGLQFCGWQNQANKRSVQSEVERALSIIANHKVTVHCAGRTDAGVHAFEQIIHFDSAAERQAKAWLLGGNSHLPADIRFLWVQLASGDFHARYSAIARLYRYVILNRAVRSALWHQQTAYCYSPLNAEHMHESAQALIGSHDFSSFRACSCQSVSPYRQLYFIDVYRQADQVIIDIAGNAFLHHMVRNIAGVLMAIGAGQKPINWTQHLLAVKDRTQAGMTAPAEGLYLTGVYYSPDYQLPTHDLFKRLPADVKRFD